MGRQYIVDGEECCRFGARVSIGIIAPLIEYMALGNFCIFASVSSAANRAKNNTHRPWLLSILNKINNT